MKKSTGTEQEAKKSRISHRKADMEK